MRGNKRFVPSSTEQLPRYHRENTVLVLQCKMLHILLGHPVSQVPHLAEQYFYHLV